MQIFEIHHKPIRKNTYVIDNSCGDHNHKLITINKAMPAEMRRRLAEHIVKFLHKEFEV